MADKEEPQEVSTGVRRPNRGVSLILITTIISILLTGVIAYGVQASVGDKELIEGDWVDGVREFRVLAPQWYYRPAFIRMDRGDTVKFIVTSGDIMHGFAINELGINLALSPGVSVAQEVVIPQDIEEGTYTMYCSIFCGIGHPYMKGNLIIGHPGEGFARFLPHLATLMIAGIFASFIYLGRRMSR